LLQDQLESSRDLETVQPEQSFAIKEKIKSIKVTETWAKTEKEKAKKQMLEDSTAEDRKKLRDLITYYEQIELQAKRRYNEVVSNQLKRMNEIIHDESRPLNERLKELFRRDGLTIGAIVTAIGMTITTIILALTPPSSPLGSPKPPNIIKSTLVKLSNWLLNLAKKALAALPGIIGSIVSFILQKAGELVLFFSEHLILLLLSIILVASEFILSKIQKKPKNKSADSTI